MAATEVARADVVRAIRAIYREFMDSVAAEISRRASGAHRRMRKRASTSPSTVASRLATGRWSSIRIAAMA